MFLGVEIGGTKLQLGLGAGDGHLVGFWRGSVVRADGAAGIRRQIEAAVPEMLRAACVERSDVRSCGIGFGGPVDDRTRGIIKSHQIAGWDGFPLAAWAEQTLGWKTAIGNDADVAALAEARHGAGQGHDPVFYVTIGSGIGGGFISGGRIYRGTGLGAAEVGHLRFATANGAMTVEDLASGWGIEKRTGISVPLLAERARGGDASARRLLDESWSFVADALCHVIALICPAVIVIGGGVALVGEDLFFEPLRRMVCERVFRPFADCFQIVPAALGEEVVIHGALALAAQVSETA